MHMYGLSIKATIVHDFHITQPQQDETEFYTFPAIYVYRNYYEFDINLIPVGAVNQISD